MPLAEGAPRPPNPGGQGSKKSEKKNFQNFFLEFFFDPRPPGGLGVRKKSVLVFSQKTQKKQHFPRPLGPPWGRGSRVKKSEKFFFKEKFF